ncbi:molybdopterin-synthase adenylyltransferase MoeB [uncultured Tolumonas sp.]|uniref:molybdopterin-synthase adenylyltransferase MoeB n=1 Tax=uncultured Tolumonas sp. TaxID=263765 RepID=UPI002A0A2D21|nr:molybdopterin-synthase adenylyltransferase MoeB [uncultured Tolumonas sp.]
MKELTDQELLRYHRQINLRSVDIDGQTALKNARVLIVGLGGLGCAAAQYLTTAGVGQLTLVDGDTVDVSNLQRQVLHHDARIGMNKAESARQTLAVLNPNCQFEVIPRYLDESSVLSLVAAHDLVLDCSDNLDTRNLLNLTCFHQLTPLVSGAAIRFEGQVAVFRWLQDEPCYHCFSQFFSNSTSANSGQSCVEAGVLAPIVGVVGSLQAMEALKLLTHAGTPLSGQLLLIDGLSGQFRSMKLKKNSDCPICGDSH